MEAVSLKNGILPHDSRSSKAKRKLNRATVEYKGNNNRKIREGEDGGGRWALVQQKEAAGINFVINIILFKKKTPSYCWH